MNANFEQAVQQLFREFNVVAKPFYLSRVFESGGKKALHNYLSELVKPEFSPNERIVIIQDRDQYEYENRPSFALELLQRYLFEIDIDNFFVVIITGNKNIAEELEQLRQSINQEMPMKYVVVEDNDINSTPTLADTFCVLPWIHVHVNTNGTMLPCCAADENAPVGNLKDSKIDDIVNGEKYKKIRSNMLAGKRSPECFRCYDFEATTDAPSSRQNQNNIFSHLRNELIANTSADGTVNDIKIRYLDVRLSNICNLKCRTCDGHYSSLLAQEENQLFSDSRNIAGVLNARERREIMPDILQHLPTVEKIYFAGGEPLIMSEHYEILDRLLDLGKTDIEISYNTNFTSLEYKDRKVVDYWKKFSNVKIGASLDGHGKVVEYVRHGTKWDIIEDNLQQIRSQVPHVRFTVSSTVSLLSVISIMELQRMWHEQNKVDITEFTAHFVIDPWLNLQVLPREFKSVVSLKIQEHIQWLSQLTGAESLVERWKAINKFMLADDQTHMLPGMYRYNKMRDNHRGESFENTFPEIYNSIKLYVQTQI